MSKGRLPLPRAETCCRSLGSECPAARRGLSPEEEEHGPAPPSPAGKSSQCHLPRKNLSLLPLTHARGPPEKLDLSSALAALHGPGSGLDVKHQRLSQSYSLRVGERGEPLPPLLWAGCVPVGGEGPGAAFGRALR